MFKLGLRSVQGGAVLATSLILLVVLTLVVVTGMRMTVMDENMAGNMRERSLAFQAAEAGVRDAEAFIEGLAAVNKTAFNGNHGLLWSDAAEPNYFDTSTSSVWANSKSNTKSRLYSASLKGVAAQPRYVVKFIGAINTNNAARANIGGYGQPAMGQDISMFKITTHGVGMAESSQVILQTHYGKIF